MLPAYDVQSLKFSNFISKDDLVWEQNARIASVFDVNFEIALGNSPSKLIFTFTDFSLISALVVSISFFVVALVSVLPSVFVV